MLPTKWTIGLCVAAALIAVISPREFYPFDIVECNLISGAIVVFPKGSPDLSGRAFPVFRGRRPTLSSSSPMPDPRRARQASSSCARSPRLNAATLPAWDNSPSV
jgi:hypothetical protein